MNIQTPTQIRTPIPARELTAATPDCHSERLWTALSARWLGRCRETETKEHETP